MALGLFSCKTTEEIQREKQIDSLSTQVVQGQRISADTLSRIQTLENGLATLSGQIEEMHHGSNQEKQGLGERVTALEEKLTALTPEIDAIKKGQKEQKYS